MNNSQARHISDRLASLGFTIKRYEADHGVMVSADNGIETRNFESYPVALGFVDGIKYALANAHLSIKAPR